MENRINLINEINLKFNYLKSLLFLGQGLSILRICCYLSKFRLGRIFFILDLSG